MTDKMTWPRWASIFVCLIAAGVSAFQGQDAAFKFLQIMTLFLLAETCHLLVLTREDLLAQRRNQSGASSKM